MEGLIWLVVLVPPLVFCIHKAHHEVQALLFSLTKRVDITLIIFSLLFFPGVFLHEMSHLLMALILGVRIGSISFWPKLIQGGKFRLGYVETVGTDVIRDLLIGIAPLITGCVLVTYIGINQLRLDQVWRALVTLDLKSAWLSWTNTMIGEDFSLWFYLTLVVSSTMFPSASDRRAWLPVFLFGTVFIIIVLLVDKSGWFLNISFPLLEKASIALSIVTGISLVVHVVFLLLLWVIRSLFNTQIG